MTLTELLQNRELSVRVDADGIASWERADGRSFGYGDTSLWLVRIRTTSDLRDPLASVTTHTVLVDGDTAEQALDAALWRLATVSTADVEDGPVALPDVDEALADALIRSLARDGADAGHGAYDGPAAQ